jgi:hypothetical protein
MTVLGSTYRCLDISSLCSDTRYKEEHIISYYLPHSGNLIWVCTTDDEEYIAVFVPCMTCLIGDFFVELAPVREFEIFEVTTSRVGCLAEDDDSLSLVSRIWCDRISAHIWIDCDGISSISFEYFMSILVCCAPDISTLGVEYDRDLWIVRMDIGDDILEICLPSVRCEVGNLRFVRTDEIVRLIDDLLQEFKNRYPSRNPSNIWIESDTEE